MQAVLNREELQGLDTEQLVGLAKRIEREKVKTDLLYFCREYLDYQDLNVELHGEVAHRLAGGEKRQAFLLPRFHLKSSLITIGWTIQQIIINQNITIGILNAVHDKILDFIREIKQHMSSERLIALFPEIFWEKAPMDVPWKEDRFCVKQSEIIAGYTVLGASIDGEITGKHFDIMIFDDIQGEKNSATALLTNKVIESYKYCTPILTPDGIQIVVGTRWKKEDFYNWLEGIGKFNFMWRCATIDEDGKHCPLHDEAIPIFPQKFSIKTLKDYRVTMGPYLYSCQMENNPLPEEDIVFREEWIKYYDEEPKLKRIYLLVDPALSLSSKSDESVISVVGQPEDDNLPLHCLKSRGIGYEQSKGDVQVVVNAIFDEYVTARRRCPDVILGIEVAAFQHILKQWIEKEKVKRKLFFEVVELKPGQRKKPNRIKALQPLFESGGILLSRRCESLVTQMLDWTPSAAHDDHLDALAYLLDVLIDAADISVKSYMDYKSNAFYDPNSFKNALAELEGNYGDLSWRDY